MVMDGISQQYPLPRLRLLRQTTPSLPPNPDHSEDANLENDDDDGSTPKRPPMDIPQDQTELETPAERLRTLLRLSNTSPSKHEAKRAQESPTILDSDLEFPNEAAHTSAQDSVRDLFTRALKEPGDTPVKDRKKGDSAGIGRAGSPPSTHLNGDLTDHQSDPDLSSQSTHSLRAAKFNSLRSRLTDAAISNVSFDDAATSTPLRQSVSVFPSHITGSNLMRDDSDMQKFMDDTHNDTMAAGTIERRSMFNHDSTVYPSFPTPGPSGLAHSAATPSAPKAIVRPSSRPSSRLSAVDHSEYGSDAGSILSNDDYKERIQDSKTGRLKALERGWNRPHSPSPQHHQSELQRVVRRASASSIGSLDDEHVERPERPESPYTRLPFSSPAARRLSHEGRSRTLSNPTRPGSPLWKSIAAQDSRPGSSLSNRGPPMFNRPPSQAGSVSSISSVGSQEPPREIVHERERNWNSPRPTWKHKRSSSSDLGTSDGSSNTGTPSTPARPSKAGHHTLSHSTGSIKATALDSRPQSPGNPPYRGLVAPSNRPGSALSPATSPMAQRHIRSNGVSTSDSASAIPPPSPSPTPGSRPSSRANGAGAIRQSHIPVRSTKSSEILSSLRTRQLDIPNKTGPPLNVVQNGDSVDHASKSLAPESSALLKPPSPIPPSLSPDSNSPPNTPVPSDFQPKLPLPAEPKYSPPPSPLPLQEIENHTPPRRPFALKKPEFQTPPQPKNMPALPDLPSFDEDSDRAPSPDPELPKKNLNPTTPRPPGGWSTPFVTPISSRTRTDFPEKSTATITEDFSLVSKPYTPPDSLSRATALQLKTPAPPGAWLVTPASRRKPFKVRFDETAGDETESVDITEDTDADTVGEPLPPSIRETPDVVVKQEPAEISVPPQTPLRMHRRSPAIRMVDAYGEELPNTDQPEPVIALQADVASAPFNDISKTSSPTRRKNKIRILDEMGREISDDQQHASQMIVPNGYADDHNDHPLSVKDMKALLLKTVAELQEDISRIDQQVPDDSMDLDHIAELNALSKKARNERSRLGRQIVAAKIQEEQLKDQSFSASFIEDPLPPSLPKRRPVARVVNVFLWSMAVTFFLLVMHRITVYRAQQLYITTYCDPYFPIYPLRRILPQLHLSAPPTTQYSPTSVPGLLVSFWHRFLDSFSPSPSSSYPPQNTSVVWPS